MTADPGAGEPAGIRTIARQHEEHAASVREASRHVANAATDAPGGWRGDAYDSFAAVAEQLPAAAARIADQLDAAASTLHDYAADVERLQDEAAALARSQRHTADDIAANDRRVQDTAHTVRSADATESDSAMLDQLQRGAEGLAALQGRQSARWAELVAEREAVDRRTASALEAPAVLGRLVSDASIGAMSRAELLLYLAGLDRDSIAALATDPEIVARLAAAAPEAIAAWWGRLSDEERDAFVTAIPAVIGNLDGVSYRDRGRANQRTLDLALPAARRRFAELAAKAGRGQLLTAAEQAEYSNLTQEIGALEAIRRTMKSSTPNAPLTIVALTLGHPPLAAVAVGDMDTASRVTVDVPGMGTTVGGSMRSWTGGAANLYLAQSRAARQLGADPNVATVAWIGYDAPAMPPSDEVLRSAKADAGAVRLSDFLAGISSTRAWTGGQNLSVVGHSYGTTTATMATARTPVENVVLLASAGVDPSVPNAGSLAVPTGHVWASQAKDDFVANIGRGSVERPGLGQGGSQPSTASGNRVTVMPIPSEHFLNPGDPSWGARTFSSNDETIDGQQYLGSDGHAATPATETLQAGRTPAMVGYLDRQTSSLRNTAYVSLGYSPSGKPLP